MKKKCYMCDKEATGKEHVPPKCFFPKSYRQGLITVPSCDDHNMKTSKDDEYVRNIIVTSYAVDSNRNNYPQEFLLFFDKAIKSLTRKNASLGKRTFKINKPVRTPNGKVTRGYQLELSRLNKTIYKIASALHYHKYKLPLNYKVQIHMKDLCYGDFSQDVYSVFLQCFEEQFATELPYEGEQPDVFKFVFGRFKISPLWFNVIKLVFYKTVSVWVLPAGVITEEMLSMVREYPMERVETTNFAVLGKWNIPIIVKKQPEILLPPFY